MSPESALSPAGGRGIQNIDFVVNSNYIDSRTVFLFGGNIQQFPRRYSTAFGEFMMIAAKCDKIAVVKAPVEVCDE